VGAVLDWLPPVVTAVFDGGAVDTAYWGHADSLTVAWTPAPDTLNGTTFEVAVCAAGVSAPVANTSACPLPFVPAGATTTSLTAAVALVPGSSYVSWVRATSPAGVSATAASDGFTVSVVVPDPAGVVVSTRPAVATWRDVAASWTPFRCAIGVSSYAVAIRTSGSVGPLPLPSAGALTFTVGAATSFARLSDYVPADVAAALDAAQAAWFATGTAATARFITVGVTATAVNGLTASAVSAALLVDPAAPIVTPPIVFDYSALLAAQVAANTTLSGTSAQPIAVTPATGFLPVAWPAGLTAPVSGIARVAVAVGTTQCGTDITPGVTVSAVDVARGYAIVPRLALQDGQRVWPTLIVTSGAGVAALVCSEAGALVDHRPPGGVPRVTLSLPAGATGDLSADGTLYQTEPILSLSWSGFADANGIARFETRTCEAGADDDDACLGSGWTTVIPATATASGATAVAAYPDMRPGTLYRVLVRAVDVAGNVGPAALSAGVTFDPTAPSMPTLLAPTQRLFGTLAAITWQQQELASTDAESPVAAATICGGTQIGWSDLFPAVPVPLHDETLSVASLAAANPLTSFAVLPVRNGGQRVFFTFSVVQHRRPDPQLHAVRPGGYHGACLPRLLAAHHRPDRQRPTRVCAGGAGQRAPGRAERPQQRAAAHEHGDRGRAVAVEAAHAPGHPHRAGVRVLPWLRPRVKVHHVRYLHRPGLLRGVHTQAVDAV
jgi:hypothetical protein